MTRASLLAFSCSLGILAASGKAVAGEQIVVTASKLGEANARVVPVTLNVFDAAQLRSLNVESLQDLSYAMPNVQLEDIGTARGIANFSIRGVGVNSSIPSVDPTVGVFVDGMYVGMNAGTLVDLLDVETVEVLRGPQGTLYGYNVTGGAVLLRTRAPGDTFEWRARLAVESGPKVIAEAAVSGPLVSGVLSGRLAMLGSHDSGWFKNGHDGSQFGENSVRIVRASLRVTPSPPIEAVLRAEYGHDAGDGPAGQNHALFARGNFGFAADNPGYASSRWKQAILQTDWHVPFGNGDIISITGWRSVDVRWAADIDSTPNFVFHTRVLNLESQRSEELRYTGKFGRLETVAGAYWFEQNLLYIDERNFSVTFRRTGGGRGYFRNAALFAGADWQASDSLIVSAGLRYTSEAKNSHISRVRRAADNLDGAAVVPGEGVAGGDIDTHTLNYSDTPFVQHWNDLSPRIALQWRPGERIDVYASWSRAFRGGGANFRTSSLGLAPRAFNPEMQSTFEIGWKQTFDKGRMAIALFHNRIDDMQRETNLADPVSGVQQAVLNAGDAAIAGGEIEARWDVDERFAMTVQVGYVHGRYSRVSEDLNGDLVVNAADARMHIPRLAPLSFGANIYYAMTLDSGKAQARLGVNHRDAAFYNDSNLGRLAEADIVDASFAYTPSAGGWSLTLYGRNLTNVATWGGDTTLPSSAAFGYSGAAVPTFSPLNKGRVVGMELRARN